MDSSAAEPAGFTAVLVFTVIAFVLESVERKSSLKASQQSDMLKQYAPEQYSGLWVRTSFAWLLVTLRLGYSKFISVNDLPLLDTQLRSSVLRQKLASTWATCELLLSEFIVGANQ